MRILALDTSGPVCGVAVAHEGGVLYEAAAENRFTHSASLLAMVDEAFTHTGLSVGEIDLFAAVVGPGSFTGVRIGVSTVKGLAHGAAKPCVAIDALEALAAGVADGQIHHRRPGAVDAEDLLDGQSGEGLVLQHRQVGEGGDDHRGAGELGHPLHHHVVLKDASMHVLVLAKSIPFLLEKPE